MGSRTRAYALTQKALDYLDATADRFWPALDPSLGPTPPIVFSPPPPGRGRCPSCFRAITVEPSGLLRGHGTAAVVCIGSGMRPRQVGT